MAKTSNDMTPDVLKKELSAGKLRPLYLFYGPEAYIKDKYKNKIADMVPDGGFPEFNRLKFEGRDAELSEYGDVLESFPMMAERRLILIKDSGIFKKAGDAEKGFWSERFKNASSDTVIIFDENEIDKRGVLYKEIKKRGSAVSFDYQNADDLTAWVNRQALKAKKKISKDTARYFVNIIEPGFSTLINEFDKLLNYCGEEITKTDVDRVASRSMQIIAFDLTNAIMEHDAAKAMRVVSGLRTSKESAFGILYLIYSSAEKLLKAKSAKTRNKFEAAQKLGVSPYVADMYLKSARSFSEDALKRMVIRVPEIDFEIKSGDIEQWTAVEQYIAECIYICM